jgi:2-C-methyl-D-erythritol 4-phosphate cytidylyltransferase / 2-C-methyl-D-erythritol 2,4-cyclodiphosphate synthase
MRAGMPKQYLPLGGRTVLEHTLGLLAAHPAIDGLAVAVASGDPHWEALAWTCEKPLIIAAGGAERCHTVLNALDALAPMAAPQDWVLVHDAARPCLRADDLQRLVDTLQDHPVGGLLGIPVCDTMKLADERGEVLRTLERRGMWHALTPQMFRYAALSNALRKAICAGVLVTDEAAAMEHTGVAPLLVEGHADNIKITRPQDLPLAELHLRVQGRLNVPQEIAAMMRIGHGFDAHALAPGRRLVLGGVSIPHERGLAGHSDGDAAIHALCDALLGAAALGDIGQHFPDSSEALKGIDSRILLRRVVALLTERRHGIGNVDVTIVAQAPRLAPHIAQMRTNLAADLGVDADRVSIKATTTERMGYTGREEGIAAHAVALLHKLPER